MALLKAELKTAPGFNDESSPTITFDLPTLWQTMTFDVGIFNASGNQSYVQYKTLTKDDLSKKSYTFVLTDGEKDNLYRATQLTETINIRYYIRTTINNNKYYSYLERSYTTVNAKPIIEPTVYDTNETTKALTDADTTLVKGHSDAVAEMTVTAQKGAVIDENFYIIRNGENTVYNTRGEFGYTEYDTFSFSAEDSRGNIGSATVKAKMIDYIPITCHIANSKPDALGNMQVYCYGNYFNDSFGKVDNTISVQCRYAEYGGSFSKWITMSPTLYDDSYTAYADFEIADFNQNIAYIFEVKAEDKLETFYRTTLPIKAVPLFHWGEEDFVFEVPVVFNGGAVGLSTDDLPEISNGIWTPEFITSSSPISSYTRQIGCYNKVGNVVTIGFFLKATCYSGYDTLNVKIGNLPFTPLLPTAGGGMCSGVYVSAGFDFQCFVAETDGTITTRVQACNNTSAANLSTSASGCRYRSGGGEITLSGTITYITSD